MKTRRLILQNAQVYSEGGIIPNGYVVIEDERITHIGEGELTDRGQGDKLIPLKEEHMVLPGMIDVHIHGVAGADTMDGTQEALERMAAVLPSEGTTSFLATTMTQTEEEIEQALHNLSLYLRSKNKAGKAEILGIHLEGPFISPKQAGAQPVEWIIPPDKKLFEKWQRLSGGHIKLVTLAPEREGGMELTSYLKETGVLASIGHSDASYKEAKQAIEAGISYATHLFNGMRGMHHRDPGVVGTVFLHDEIVSEIIVDGIHVCPEMVDLSYQQKGKEGLILITDAMRAKCLGNGHYTLGGQDVQVSDGKALLQDGTLAGSILKMKEAISNMISYTNCTVEDIVYMTAVNPAKQLGVFDRKGSIGLGKDADLVILDEQYEVMMTFCRGKLAYQHDEFTTK